MLAEHLLESILLSEHSACSRALCRQRWSLLPSNDSLSMRVTTRILDHLTGLLALYLSTSRADFLKGGLTSIDWDVEEMEAHEDEITKRKLLQIKWIPNLPASGGQGL